MKHLDIKRALAEHGMTQAELCKKTGILSQNMRTITNGNPTIEKLFTVAEGIGCDITDLFYSSENSSTTSDSSNQGSFSSTSSNMDADGYFAHVPLQKNTEEKNNIELDILRYVKEHDIPMVKVAQAAGMVPQNIKKCITNNPKADTIANIANGLGVHPGVFFYAQDNQKEEDVFRISEMKERVERIDEQAEKTSEPQHTIETVSFCPHCGGKVRVGVVLLPE